MTHEKRTIELKNVCYVNSIFLCWGQKGFTPLIDWVKDNKVHRGVSLKILNDIVTYYTCYKQLFTLNHLRSIYLDPVRLWECLNQGSLITWLNDSLCARVVKILRLKMRIQTNSEPFICVRVINKLYLGSNNTNLGTWYSRANKAIV